MTASLPRGPKWRRRLGMPLALVGLALSVAGVASAADTSSTVFGPYNIGGTVPDAGVGAAIPDDNGSTKELGPLNSSTTKIGVIHNDAVPTLGLTNPNAQVDLNTTWLDLKRYDGKDWLYFAWERDSNSGSGFIAYEFMKSAAPSLCVYNPPSATLVQDCNPFANRAAGDFMILWDQQGGNRVLKLRRWSGTAPNLVLGPVEDLDAYSRAEYGNDGFQGEAAVNLTDALNNGAPPPCTTISNTVPSTVTGNSDTADYKDTVLTRKTLSTCGDLAVKKYIDVNANGKDAGDETTGSRVSGWSFTVKGPSPSTTTVCSGTTGTDGQLTCTSGSLTGLTAGTYTVTETQKSGWANTDPGPLPADTGATVSRTATVSVGGSGTVEFGNTCYVSTTFRTTGVPAGSTGVFAWYTLKPTALQVNGSTVNSLGYTNGTDKVKVALSPTASGSTTYEGTVSSAFIPSTVIDYGYGQTIGGNDTFIGPDPGNTNVTIGSGSACTRTLTVAYTPSTVRGFKFLDTNASGTKDAGEPGLGGFEFKIYQDSNGNNTIDAGELKSTATSLSTASGGNVRGDYVFPDAIAPGTYKVKETAVGGWQQTLPASGADRTVTVTLGQNATVADFGNTPLSKIDATFTSLAQFPGTTTDATKASSIACVPATGSSSSTTTANTVTANNLTPNQSQVVCTITYGVQTQP